jgi:hypothetical protein
MGLVLSGERTMNWFQKKLAASWVKKLYSLAPEGQGVDRVLFFNMVESSLLKGRSRTHPLSDLIEEHYVWAAPAAGGTFEFQHRLQEPKGVLALWISSDGDDTQSNFTLVFEEIHLQLASEQKMKPASLDDAEQ